MLSFVLCLLFRVKQISLTGPRWQFVGPDCTGMRWPTLNGWIMYRYGTVTVVALYLIGRSLIRYLARDLEGFDAQPAAAGWGVRHAGRFQVQGDFCTRGNLTFTVFPYCITSITSNVTVCCLFILCNRWFRWRISSTLRTRPTQRRRRRCWGWSYAFWRCSTSSSACRFLFTFFAGLSRWKNWWNLGSQWEWYMVLVHFVIQLTFSKFSRS